MLIAGNGEDGLASAARLFPVRTGVPVPDWSWFFWPIYKNFGGRLTDDDSCYVEGRRDRRSGGCWVRAAATFPTLSDSGNSVRFWAADWTWSEAMSVL
jgi:hypothetical protein